MKRLALGFVAAWILVACGNPITAANVQGCIKKNCGEAEALGYQQCEAACRQTYGP